jgi:hypothetical protein
VQAQHEAEKQKCIQRIRERIRCGSGHQEWRRSSQQQPELKMVVLYAAACAGMVSVTPVARAAWTYAHPLSHTP